MIARKLPLISAGYREGLRKFAQKSWEARGASGKLAGSRRSSRPRNLVGVCGSPQELAGARWNSCKPGAPAASVRSLAGARGTSRKPADAVREALGNPRKLTEPRGSSRKPVGISGSPWKLAEVRTRPRGSAGPAKLAEARVELTGIPGSSRKLANALAVFLKRATLCRSSRKLAETCGISRALAGDRGYEKQ